ncbi:unnamed protein product [Rotaria sp. Silwood2]|nr:unnamed protein product [Rotaria sp. Silwood2]
MGFFIRDLHTHIVTLHAQQYTELSTANPFTVYRGQGLSKVDLDQLIKTKGGLLSFNNFISTSTKRQVSLGFARRTMATSDLVGILFVMKIDPSIPSTPFADISDVSYYKREEEILFSMHSIFRIGSIEQIDENQRLWQVNLALTCDDDPELHALTEHMRKEIHPHKKGWDRLAMLLIKLGQFDKAQKIYDTLLDQTPTDLEKISIYNIFGLIKEGQGKYKEAASYYQQSHEISKKILSQTDTDLAASLYLP